MMTNRIRAMRASFAMLAKLLTEDERDVFWTKFKALCKVESRAELTEKQLVLLEAKLRAAENDSTLHKKLKQYATKE